jgi:hypothetical protein
MRLPSSLKTIIVAWLVFRPGVPLSIVREKWGFKPVLFSGALSCFDTSPSIHDAAT